MTKQITQEQYWQVTGLLVLAKAAKQRVDDVESSLRSLFRVEKADEGVSGIGSPDHIGDAVWSDYSTDDLLEKLGVTVVKPKEASH